MLADAMARVQQLISDLNLEDSVVLQTRVPPRKSTPTSLSSPIIVRQIAGDPPAPQASRNARGSQRLLVDDVFDDEGFERVDRRKSRKTPPPTPSPPTYQRRQTGSDSARPFRAESLPVWRLWYVGGDGVGGGVFLDFRLSTRSKPSSSKTSSTRG